MRFIVFPLFYPPRNGGCVLFDRSPIDLSGRQTDPETNVHFLPQFFTTGRNIYVSDYKHLAAEKISCRFACLVKEKMYNFS